MKHFWHILFVASTILSVFFPWVLLSALGCLAMLGLEKRHREKELAEAIAKHEESALLCKTVAAQFNERLQSLNELKGQVDNLKSSISLSFGRKQ